MSGRVCRFGGDIIGEIVEIERPYRARRVQLAHLVQHVRHSRRVMQMAQEIDPHHPLLQVPQCAKCVHRESTRARRTGLDMAGCMHSACDVDDHRPSIRKDVDMVWFRSREGRDFSKGGRDEIQWGALSLGDTGVNRLAPLIMLKHFTQWDCSIPVTVLQCHQKRGIRSCTSSSRSCTSGCCRLASGDMFWGW